ncbi:MAG: hypothetical protein MJA29_04905 [Candidatus Omnitrophica bacterium]|nr:hypothetical protein [Candidatus Omnitrophota bacterium]
MEFSEKEIALLNKWEKMVARRRIICLSFLLILLTGVVTLLLGIRHQVEINILGGFYLLIVVAVAFKYYSEARKL